MSKISVQVGLKQLMGYGGNGLECYGIPFSSDTFCDSTSTTSVSVAVICGASSERNLRLIKNIINQVNSRTHGEEYLFVEQQNPCQRNGIWMCSKPLKYFSEPGKPGYLVLMEVKGRIDEFSTHSNVADLMEIALLLSSVFIFNFGENIDEDVLQKLSPLANFAKQCYRFIPAEYYRDRILGNSLGSAGLLEPKPFQNISIFKSIGQTEGLLTSSRSSAIPMGLCGSNKFHLLDILGRSSRQTYDAKAARELILAHAETVSYSVGLDEELMLPVFNVDSSKKLCGIPIFRHNFIEFVELTIMFVFSCKNGRLKEISILKERLLHLALRNFHNYVVGVLLSKVPKNFSPKPCITYGPRFEKLNSVLNECFRKLYSELEHSVNNSWSRDDPLGIFYGSGLNCRDDNDVRRFRSILVRKLKNLESRDEKLPCELRKLFENKLLANIGDQLKERRECASSCVNAALRQCISVWDNTCYIPDANFSTQWNAIEKAAMVKMKLVYPDIENDFARNIMQEGMEYQNILAETNEQAYVMISSKLRNTLVLIMEKLADTTITEVNAGGIKSLEEFNRFCKQQKDMHEDYFLRHYRNNFCKHVFSMEWPKCQVIFDHLVTVLKNKYIDRSVADALIKREDVFEELDMNPSISHENTTRVQVDFGSDDIKNIVFPKLQIHIVNILTDKQTTTMVILQLCELGIFDAIEMELPLHGKFQLERERALALSRVIQNRNSDEIKLCLQCLCNLRDLEATSFRFRKVFTSVTPGCFIS